MAFLLASAGPITGLVEAAAGSIGSGAVIGGFVGGIGSGLRAETERVAEKWTVSGGYVGGLVGLLALTIDSIAKYFV